MKTKTFLSSEICYSCGGICCERSPAPFLPSDIERLFGTLEKAHEAGAISIDWWEGESVKYFVRPRTIKDENPLFNASWGGRCIFKRDNGCQIGEYDRPLLCRRLEPHEDKNNCNMHIKHHEKLLSAFLWKRSGLLKKFMEERDK